jgi:hypothetical protein
MGQQDGPGSSPRGRGVVVGHCVEQVVGEEGEGSSLV